MSTLEPAGGAADLADGTPAKPSAAADRRRPGRAALQMGERSCADHHAGGDRRGHLHALSAQLLVRDRRRARRLHAGGDDVRQPVGLPGQRRVPSGRADPGAALAARARAVGGDLRRAVVRIRRASCCGTSSGSNSRPTASASARRPIWKRRSGFRGSRWRSALRRCCSRSSALSSPMCAVSAGSRMGPELQIIIVTVLFLGLLTAGMAVPFAIAVPAIIYLLMQGGFPALNGLGLMSWGSMNTFALTAVPLFMFMADILSVSGLSNRIYNGLAKLVAPLPGGLLQTNIAGCAIFASVSGSSIATAASIGGVALPQLTRRNYNSDARGGIARGGRHARHSHSAELPDDHLRHVHRDLGAEAVHRRRDPRPDHDRLLHALYRGACALRSARGAEGTWREEHPRSAARDRRHRAVLRSDLRHARRALFRRRHHHRSRRDRLLPVAAARLRVRRPHLAQARSRRCTRR